MSRRSTIFPAFLAIALLFPIMMQPTMAPAAAESSPPHFELGVSFEPERNLLRGTAKITIPAGSELNVSLGDLQVTAALLSQPGKENRPLLIDTARTIPLAATADQQELLISYEKRMIGSPLDTIDEHAIILTSGWHPRPDRPALFSGRSDTAGVFRRQRIGYNRPCR